MSKELVGEHELGRFGKPPGSKWFLQEEVIVQGTPPREISVKTISPYDIPWPKSKGPRPRDYFDKMERFIDFVDDGKKVSIHVSGQGRHEQMIILIDSVPMHFSGMDRILTMSKTFSLDDLMLLEDIIQEKQLLSKALGKSVPDNQYITPYMSVFDERESRAEAKESVRACISGYIKAAKDLPGSRRIIMPIVRRSRPNDPSHHWYCCVITLDGNNNPSITFVDSTNKMKKQTLKQVTQEYYDDVVEDVNEALRDNGFKEVTVEMVGYSQGLQYGEMGCGITTSINMEKVLLGERFGKFEESDQEMEKVPKYTVVYKNFDDGIQTDHGVDADGLATLEAMGLEIHSKKKTSHDVALKGLKTDKSEAGDIVQEVLRRFELAKKIQEREEIAKRLIPDDIRKKLSPVTRMLRQSQAFRDRRATAEADVIDRSVTNIPAA